MECDFSKGAFLPGFVAFGGGRYMCPGRWYALMELHMIISMLFHRYDMSLDSKLPAPVSPRTINACPSRMIFTESSKPTDSG